MKALLTVLFTFCATVTFAQDEATTFIVVRHAEKADVGSDPYLSEAGIKRAECLAEMLKSEKIAAIYSTPYNRTKQTAKPLAEGQQLEVTEYNPSNGRFIDELKTKHKGETVVIVGHSNTVPLMLNSIAGAATYQQLGESDYDKLYVAITTQYKPLKILNLRLVCN